MTPVQVLDLLMQYALSVLKMVKTRRSNWATKFRLNICPPLNLTQHHRSAISVSIVFICELGFHIVHGLLATMSGPITVFLTPVKVDATPLSSTPRSALAKTRAANTLPTSHPSRCSITAFYVSTYVTYKVTSQPTYVELHNTWLCRSVSFH